VGGQGLGHGLAEGVEPGFAGAVGRRIGLTPEGAPRGDGGYRDCLAFVSFSEVKLLRWKKIRTFGLIEIKTQKNKTVFSTGKYRRTS
jgi:hypothetical protein